MAPTTKTTASKLDLPASSYEGLVKIITGYGHSPGGVGLTALSQLVDISRNRVSGNNKFLSEIGIIDGTISKKITDPIGKGLSRALEHDRQEDITKSWQLAVKTSDKILAIITAVQIQKGKSEADLVSDILFKSGQSKTKTNRTGAKTIVEILKKSALLWEEEGILKASPESHAEVTPEDLPTSEETRRSPSEPDTPHKLHKLPATPTASMPTVNINIQLHLPETENADVYEKLFRSLRKNLLNTDE